MNISKVSDEIFKLSINLEDALFEGMWPVPNGVTMNSYIIRGEKTALIDGICGWDGMPESLYVSCNNCLLSRVYHRRCLMPSFRAIELHFSITFLHNLASVGKVVLFS